MVHPSRKVPVPQREKVIEELKRMEKLGVIVRQEDPTEWVNSIVVVQKPCGAVRLCIDPRDLEDPTEWVNSLVVVQKPCGAVRLCIDPRDLDKALKRTHYPMKTVGEVACRLQDDTTFGILDAKSGFWQLKLDDE